MDIESSAVSKTQGGTRATTPSANLADDDLLTYCKPLKVRTESGTFIAVASWSFAFTSELNRDQFALRYGADINNVVSNAFCGQKQNLSIQSMLMDSDIVGLVIIDTRVVGVCFLSIPVSLFFGRSFVWVDKIAIDPVAQGMKLSTARLLQGIREFLPTHDLGYVGMCTQNPRLIASYSKVGIANYPVNADYSSGKGPAIMKFISREVNQCKIRMLSDLNQDYSSGIFRGLYNGNITPDKVDSSAYPPAISKVGFDPNNGDAVFLISIV